MLTRRYRRNVAQKNMLKNIFLWHNSNKQSNFAGVKIVLLLNIPIEGHSTAQTGHLAFRMANRDSPDERFPNKA